MLARSPILGDLANICKRKNLPTDSKQEVVIINLDDMSRDIVEDSDQRNRSPAIDETSLNGRSNNGDSDIDVVCNSSDETVAQTPSPILADITNFCRRDEPESRQEVVVINLDENGSVDDFRKDIVISLDVRSQFSEVGESQEVNRKSSDSEIDVICNSSDEDVVAMTERSRTNKRRKLDEEESTICDVVGDQPMGLHSPDSISEEISKQNQKTQENLSGNKETEKIGSKPAVKQTKDRLLISPRQENKRTQTLYKNPLAISNTHSQNSSPKIKIQKNYGEGTSKGCSQETDVDTTLIIDDSQKTQADKAEPKEKQKSKTLHRNPLAKKGSPEQTAPSTSEDSSKSKSIVILSDIVIQGKKRKHGEGQAEGEETQGETVEPPIDIGDSSDESEEPNSGWMKKDNTTQIKCTVCKLPVENLRSHMFQFHTEAKHVCKVCSKAYKRRGDLISHVNRTRHTQT